MRNLNSEELGHLYTNYMRYLHEQCNGHADMGVKAFHEKFGLGPWTA